MENNPYATPASDVIQTSPPEGQELAERGTRFAAVFLDGIFLMVILVPLQYFTGAMERNRIAAEEAEGIAMFFPNFGETMLWTLLGFILWIALHFTSLANGQTLGKRIMKIKVVRKNGDPLERKRYVFLRHLSVVGFSSVPLAGALLGLVDILLIFRKDRNTLHDDIADTKVIKCEPAS